MRTLKERVGEVLAATDGAMSPKEICARLGKDAPKGGAGQIAQMFWRERDKGDKTFKQLKGGRYKLAKRARKEQVWTQRGDEGGGAPGDLTWADAAAEVLQREWRPVHYREIADSILASDLTRTVPDEPAAQVNVVMSKEIRDNPDTSRFVRTEPGVYALRKYLVAVAADPKERGQDGVQAIEGFGMFWRRSDVNWAETRPKLWGAHLGDEEILDLSNKCGVYVLHDRARTIYVGRAVDQPIVARLRAHTKDRHDPRWDRFSWFAASAVGTNGGTLTSAAFLAALEAVLIEVLEPPQNRRRGDGLSDLEYVQERDPELK